MASDLPYWVQLLQALTTPAIAFGAATIDALQWYTAHRKTVIDLFEKRIKIYHDFRDVIRSVQSRGDCESEDLLKFDAVYDEASFLFGKNVLNYLSHLRDALIMLHHHGVMENDLSLTEIESGKHIKQKAMEFKKIRESYRDFPGILRPYILLDQKTPGFILWRQSIFKKHVKYK